MEMHTSHRGAAEVFHWEAVPSLKVCLTQPDVSPLVCLG